MRVLVVGRGGREHASVYTISRSSRVKKVYVAPGNLGTAELVECVNIAGSDVKDLAVFAKEQEIDLTIVGPEATLSLGIVDAFQAEGLKIFGSTEDAVQVELNKNFAKKIMVKYDTPTASYQTFDNKMDAIGYVEYQGASIIVKGDGLKAGEGVIIVYKLKEALDAIEIVFSAPENRVVTEECLEGFEFFLACFVCDSLVLPIEVVQGHKAVYNGDKGPNADGMGVYSPIKKITPDVVEETMNAVMMPMAKTMVKEGHPFTGFLYGELIPTKHGVKTTEFSARFGDPEAEVILPRLKTSFCDVIENIMSHFKAELEWDNRITLGVIMASKGYPAFSARGAVTKNLENANFVVPHMGMAEREGSLETDGGRVPCVCAVANTLEGVYEKAHVNVRRVHRGKLFYRNDVGKEDM